MGRLMQTYKALFGPCYGGKNLRETQTEGKGQNICVVIQFVFVFVWSSHTFVIVQILTKSGQIYIDEFWQNID